jgi:cytoskeletal protein CcmA (bactofilin family)
MELYRESLIAEGVKFDGRLIFEGTLKLAGTFEGDIYSPDKLIVMATGIVRGNIDADEVYIAGKVEGQIRARTRIEIAEAGYVKGDIQAPILKIHEGGLFEGASSMTKLDD